MFRIMPNYQTQWKRIPSKCTYYFSDDQWILSFQHIFSYSPTETTYFAFSYPFSYQESTEKIDQMEAVCKSSKNIYFHREVLYHSLESRPLEIVTITSKDGMMNEREEMPEDADGLYPDSSKG